VLKDCRQLIELDLQFNQMKRLPESIAHNRQLTKLNVANNQITELPPTLAHLKWTLKTLNADMNPLTSPPSDVIERGTDAILEYLWQQFSGKEAVNRYHLDS